MSNALEISKLSNKSNVKGSAASLKQKTISRHYGKSSVPIFQEISTSTNKSLFGDDDLALDNNYITF